MQPQRSLRSMLNVHHPTIFNRLWVPQTVQHLRDQRLIHIAAVSHTKNNKAILPLRRRLIPPACILTVLHLCLLRLKVLHNDCRRIHLSHRLYRHLHHQFLQAPEAMHLLVLLPAQLLILVVHRLVHKAMAEITGTRWQPSTTHCSKPVKDRASEVGEGVVWRMGLQCQILVHQHQLLGQPTVPDPKCRCRHRKIKVDLICFPVAAI